MSSSTPIASARDRLSALNSRLAGFVRAGAFWTGVTLPLLYVPPLVLGFGPFGEVEVVLTFLVVNLLACVVGHEHEPTTGRRR